MAVAMRFDPDEYQQNGDSYELERAVIAACDDNAEAVVEFRSGLAAASAALSAALGREVPRPAPATPLTSL